MFYMYNFNSDENTTEYRGLVKWYDRGLQNLWWEFDSLIPCYDRKLESLVKSRFFSFFVLSENINTKLDGRNRVCYIDFIKITVHNERKTGER